MKKLILLFIVAVAGSACAQSSNVTINANGTILNGQTIKFGAGKLQVNGVEVFGTPLQTGNSGKFLTTNGTALSWGTTLSGTVTSVAVSGASGIGVTGSPITSAGTIALSLGAITPASVAAVGAVSGSNLSGTNTGDQTSVTGNAGTATALQTARTINGVSFNGTANITVPAAGSTLTDTVPVSKGGTGGTTLTAHGVLIGDGTSAVAVTSAGTSGQVLTSNGASADPTFQAAAGGAPFTDTTALVKGSVDPTSLLRFEADDITPGETRVLTAPDYDGNIATLAGSEAFSNKISLAVGTPTATGKITSFGAGEQLRLALNSTEYFSATMSSGSIHFNLTTSLGGGAGYFFDGLDVSLVGQSYEPSTWENSNIAATQGGVEQALALNRALIGKGVNTTSDDTVASASTINLTSVGPQVQLTGTATVNTITLPEGEIRVVRTTGAVPLVNGANLLLPNGENFTTAANSWFVAEGLAAGVVKASNVFPADFSIRYGGDFSTGGSFMTDSDVYMVGTFNTGGNFNASNTFETNGPFFTGGAFSVTSDLTIDGPAAIFRTGIATDSTFPAGTHTLAISDAAQTFTGNQTVNGIITANTSAGSYGMLANVSGTGSTLAHGMFQPSLSNGNEIQFGIGKAWATDSSAYVAFSPNATAANNRLIFGFYGAADIFNVFQGGGVSIGSTTNPGTGNLSLTGAVIPGGTAATWTSGAGSPESVRVAVVGSLFTRTDGGAGTTLYVKESGAGNTGWIAK